MYCFNFFRNQSWQHLISYNSFRNMNMEVAMCEKCRSSHNFQSEGWVKSLRTGWEGVKIFFKIPATLLGLVLLAELQRATWYILQCNVMCCSALQCSSFAVISLQLMNIFYFLVLLCLQATVYKYRYLSWIFEYLLNTFNLHIALNLVWVSIWLVEETFGTKCWSNWSLSWELKWTFDSTLFVNNFLSTS